MIWFVFAGLTALFESVKDVMGKRLFNNDLVDEYLVAWAMWFFAFPLLALFMLITGVPSVNNMFWIALPVGGLLNLFASVLYMKAIRHADLSLVVPLITFTPLFLLVTSPVIVGEVPDMAGLGGVVLIVLGSYLLQVRMRTKGLKGLFRPFLSLVKMKGPRYMLLVAFIWSISANIDKVGVMNSSPVFWVTAMSLVVSTGLFPMVIVRLKTQKNQIPQGKDTISAGAIVKALVPVGLIYGFVVLNQMLAINLTLVSYVISIKRMSAVFAVIWGVVLFKEKGVAERLPGVVIMVAGVLMITVL